jgi:PASTA domain
MVAGPNLASPVDGTVINWHTEGFSGTFRVRVIQFGAGNVGTATASGPSVTLGGGSNDQSLSLPIKTGELIGFDNSSGADMAKVLTPSSTYTSAAWGPGALPDNSPQPAATTFPLEFAMNATVRYCLVPKVKGKKIGAAKKALANAGCSLGKVKKKKGQKGAKFVRSQAVAPGTSLADGAAVKVKAGPKPKK